MEAGEEVTEVEPEEDGYVTVQKETGEQGSVPAASLSSIDPSSSRDVKEKKLKIKSHQRLIGTKVVLEAGEIVTQVGEEEDGYITVLTDSGQQGCVPVNCIGKFKFTDQN